jgi:hypothetical protein
MERKTKDRRRKEMIKRKELNFGRRPLLILCFREQTKLKSMKWKKSSEILSTQSERMVK